MNNKFLNILLFLLTTSQLFAQIPSSNIHSWHSADTAVTISEGKVIQWNDLSGNGYHLIQAIPTNQPNLIDDALNFLPVVRFSQDHFMGVDYILPIAQPATFFILWKTVDEQGPAFSINNSNADGLRAETGNRVFARAGNNFLLNRTTPFDYLLHTWEINGNNSKLFENSLLEATGNSGGNSITKLLLGRLTGFPAYKLQGDIAEIVLVDKILSTEERVAFETYLMDKYTPTLDLGDTINVGYGFCPTLINAGPNFQNYTWSTGEETQEIEALKQGFYKVMVTDIFERTTTDSIYISYPNTQLNDLSPNLCLESSREIYPQILNPELYTFEWSTGATTHSIEVSEEGSYWVKITDDQGCFAWSDTLVLHIDDFATHISLGPDLDLCSGNTIGLTPTDPETDIISYLWSTGETTPEITITESGNYTIEVVNKNGCIATDDIQINVIGTAPIVNFETTTACLGTPTEFTDLSQTVEGDNAIAWEWNFGNDIFSEEQNPSYTFVQPGLHPVSLVVTAESGCNQQYADNVEVLDTPSAFFQATEACINIPYQLTDLSTSQQDNEIIQWNWQINGTEQSIQQNPVFSFDAAGNYEITLTTASENGCIDSFTNTINIVDSSPLPSAFTIFYPKQSQVIPSETLLLQWNEASNTNEYIVEISTDSLFKNTNFVSESTTENSLQITLAPGSYFARISALNICLDINYSESVSFSIPDLTSYGNLKLWLSADSVTVDETERIAQVFDKSGNENHALQTNSVFQPIKLAQVPKMNNMPAMVFNGTNQFFNGSVIDGIENSSMSLFIVSTGSPATEASEYKTLFSIDNSFWIGRFVASIRQNMAVLNNNAVNGIFGSYPNEGKTTIHSFLKDIDNRGYLYENKVINISDQTIAGAFTNNNYKVGLSSSLASTKHWHGQIFEVLLFDSFLSDSEREKIELYFHHKYSPPLNLGPDKNIPYGFCPVTLDAGERFQTYLWSTGETTQSIEVNEPGTYSVEVTDIFGFRSSDSLEVRFPDMGLSVKEVVMCEGESVEVGFSVDSRKSAVESRESTVERQELAVPGSPFKGAGGSPINHTKSEDYTYAWSTGETTPNIVITETGNYTLTVMDTLGCSRQFTVDVFVDDFELTATLGEDLQLCGGDEIGLIVGSRQSTVNSKEFAVPGSPLVGAGGSFPIPTPKSQISDYLWSTGATTPTIPIWETDEYSVMAINENGCVARDTIQVEIIGTAPQVDFAAEAVCLGDTMRLIDNSTPGEVDDEIVFWNWELSDGTNSNAEEFDHLFADAGYWDVSLYVETEVGCRKSATRAVQVYHLPEGWFTPNNTCTDVPVTFLDASTDVEGGIGQWRWRFLDEEGNELGQSEEAQPQFTFTEPGEGLAELTAISAVGCRDTIMRSINIRESPRVEFDFTTPCLGDPVFFTDQTSAPVWASVIGQQWSFGDGNSSPQNNPSHLYAEAGVYDVTLNVTAVNGCAPSLTKSVTVHSPPSVFFPAPDLCVNTPHTFLDQSTVENSTVNEWQWQFGEMGQSTEQNPEYTFTEPGQYSISLLATSAAGCRGSITQLLDVHPAPEPVFSFFPRYGVAPLTVSFNNLTEGASVFSWEFGDGTAGSDLANPTHTYTENGIYQPQLTAFTDLGCAGQITEEIKVIPLSIDIAVTDVSWRIVDNFLEISANLMNMGTLEFDTLFLEFHVSGRDPVRERWTGMLRPGEIQRHTFNAQLPWNEQFEYFCVEAFIPRHDDDDDMANNSKCLAFEEDFALLPAYPNPAGEYVNIGFVLPYSDQVTITLSNLHGHDLGTIYDGNADQGITTLRIPTGGMGGGIYIYRISFREETKVGRFMVW